LPDLAAKAARSARLSRAWDGSMALHFVTPVNRYGPSPPTGATHDIPGKLGVLERHPLRFVGIVGDRDNVVKSVSAAPNVLTIEDAGVAAGGIHWFRLSPPREARDITIQAKDARGTIVASFVLSVMKAPPGSGPIDLDLDPANPGTINLRVYKAKDDADYIDRRMEGIGYNLYLGGFQVHCTGMSVPIDVPYRLVDLNLNEAEPIDEKVHDTLAAANDVIGKVPAKKGVTRFAFYRGAGGAVIAPTIFSPATTPRIIATFYEARRLYADYVLNALSGTAVNIVGGMVLRTFLGSILRKVSDDPVPPRRPPPVPIPAKIRPLNGTVDVGGTGGQPPVTNLNPVKPFSGGQSRNIPNHVPAEMEKMDDIFQPGSVQRMESIKLRYQDVNWTLATRAAAKVMPKGGKVYMNIWTQTKQQFDALVSAFEKAGFQVNKTHSFHRPGVATIIDATRL